MNGVWNKSGIVLTLARSEFLNALGGKAAQELAVENLGSHFGKTMTVLHLNVAIDLYFVICVFCEYEVIVYATYFPSD